MRISTVAAPAAIALALAALTAAPASASERNWGFQALLYASFPAADASAPLLAPAADGPVQMTSLLARETAVLTREGIAPARASEDIDVQGRVARSDLLSKLESGLAGAFAGAWFEPTDAQVHVGATSPADARRIATLAADEGLTRREIVVTPVRSSWAELSAAQTRWDGRLTELFAHAQVKTSLSAEKNALFVTLGASVPSAERALLERQARVADVNVVIATSKRARLGESGQKETKCKAFAEDKAFCEKPITSGVRIEQKGGAEICTAGPMAIPVNSKLETYVLTAGHCIDEREGLWSATNTKAETKEIGESKTWVLSEAGDYGEILVETNFWKEANPNPVFALTAEWGKAGAAGEKSYPVKGKKLPMEKQPDCLEGQTSGEKCGKVGLTSVAEKINGVLVKGLVEDTAESAAGDSGGPYLFIEANNEVLMEGTHVAANLYMPLEKTLKDLKLELLTTANEVRPACS